LEKEHKLLEERVRNLERISREYANRNRYILSECYKINEKNQQLEKLISCLTSILAIQGYTGYRELPATENPVSFKKEYMLILRSMVAEALAGLSNYTPTFDPIFIRKKQITYQPMGDYENSILEKNPSAIHEEESKEHKSSMDLEEFSMGKYEPSIPPSPNMGPHSPFLYSPLLSPSGSPRNGEYLLSPEPLPYYLGHEEMQLNNELSQDSRVDSSYAFLDYTGRQRGDM